MTSSDLDMAAPRFVLHDFETAENDGDGVG